MHSCVSAGQFAALSSFSTAIRAQPAITSGRILNILGNQQKPAPGGVCVIYGSGLGPATALFRNKEVG